MTLVKFNQHPAKSFNGLFNDLFGNHPLNRFWNEDANQFFSALPPVNIVESKDAYKLDVVAPGFEKSDFKINLEGDQLTISVEKKENAIQEGDKQVRREFSFKSFKRSFSLDESVDIEKINAKYENGVLALVLPKKEEKQVANKEITIA
ncbi:heat-shock protein Hsp20 [Chitinophaga caeni]|uniref:Heat-shock protein Hsp20 n=1 Tax=Chitinophaga caeni TaxID=2029983 RepID=A0A291QVC4_9BACT|nr:Hsp20/alpha crystallin family protein [Chitinophaga caeni]ATL47890.1 heat-shock protein Hsp20 [Chitinophaga caeni]